MLKYANSVKKSLDYKKKNCDLAINKKFINLM